ncbi:MAG: NADH-quinone oxidoreductase subunit K [Candidatus Micrarchaeaceae archaeon]
MILEFVLLGFAMFAIGISGIAASRHFVLMMLSVEVALIAATLVGAAFFYYVSSVNILIFLLAVWSVASVEVLSLVVFYRYLARNEVSMDVTKLSKLRD